MKSNKEPSFEPQTLLATSTLVGYSPITFNATIITLIIETEFSTSIA
jgi:hypothetical protein